MSEVTLQTPYSTPNSDVTTQTAAYPLSIEQALSRRYDFSILGLLGEAWRKTSGTKGIIWGGIFVFYAALSAVATILFIVMSLFGALGAVGLASIGGEGAAAAGIFGALGLMLIATLVILAVAYPFIAGINMIGIRQAAGQPVRFSEVFGHFNRTVPLLIAGILIGVLTQLGMMLLIVPGIYLSIAAVLTIPLVVERKLSPWQAFVVSCKAITQHWFKVFFLFLLMGAILVISTIPFGIGLIWTIPMFAVMIGVLYNTIFGVLPAN